jgi:hypothetical protein
MIFIDAFFALIKGVSLLLLLVLGGSWIMGGFGYAFVFAFGFKDYSIWLRILAFFYAYIPFGFATLTSYGSAKYYVNSYNGRHERDGALMLLGFCLLVHVLIITAFIHNY